MRIYPSQPDEIRRTCFVIGAADRSVFRGGPMGFDGKVALVTGASRGIGRAIALELGSQGARIAVNYLRQAQAADEVAKAITEAGSEAETFQADVGDFAQAEK